MSGFAGYKATEKDGVLVIHNVPIFVECQRGEHNFDKNWISQAVAKAMQATISRKRETLADISACQITRYPPGLIAALEKLRDDVTVTHSATTATAHLWIEQPMSGVTDGGKMGWFHKLFATHPPLEERIATLREL